MPSAKPIHLEVRKVALAAKKAYDRKRLSAQGVYPQCMYRDFAGRPCAIGAAMPARTARRLDNSDLDATSVVGLYDAGLLSTDNIDALKSLQEAHDDWAQSVPGGETKFTALIADLLAVEA